MEFFVGAMFFLFGLAGGSFVNMLVYRTAVDYKLERNGKIYDKNRSFCDYCGKRLSWRENVPVVSWLRQRGQTVCCHKKLPILYPIVELLLGVLLLINFKFLNGGNEVINVWLMVISSIMVTMMMFSGVFDLKYKILPDFSTILLLVLSLGISLINRENLLNNLSAALIGAGFLLVLNLATKGKGMGMGDVKLALVMGVLLGPQKTLAAFYMAFIGGALVGGGLMLFKKIGRKSEIAFGPFLIGGTMSAWWGGDFVIDLVSKFIK